MSKDLLLDLDAFYTGVTTNTISPRPASAGPSWQTNLVSQSNFIRPVDSFGQPARASSQPSSGQLIDDDFGDFEDAEPADILVRNGTNLALASTTHHQLHDGGTKSLHTTSALIPQSDSIGRQTPASPSTKPFRRDTLRDPNVLFDADEEPSSEDETFGDFQDGFEDEVPSNEPRQGTTKLSSKLVDFLADDTDDTQPPSIMPEIPWQAHSKVSSFRMPQDKAPALSMAADSPLDTRISQASDEAYPSSGWDSVLPEPHVQATKQLSQDVVAQEASSADQDDFTAWDDIDGPPTVRPIRSSYLWAGADAVNETLNSPEDNPWAEPQDKHLAVTGFQASASVPASPSSSSLPMELSEMPLHILQISQSSKTPPTNVPPPSVLLALFPPIISSVRDNLLRPFSSLSRDDKESAVSHPQMQLLVRVFLDFIIVASRIIAGRKHRWKRDARLAQGMRIGAAGGKGMKLAGVDKAELAREDREIAEVVRTWKEQVGKVRSAVAQINSAMTSGHHPGDQPVLVAYDLRATMNVRELKQKEGGIPSKRPCALCGLKREERVVGVEDSDVGDAFGEWWTEGVGMHRGCVDFWDNQEPGLRGR